MSERLQSLYVNEDRELVISMEGGGVAMRFIAGMQSEEVASRLRKLAVMLEKNVQCRVPATSSGVRDA